MPYAPCRTCLTICCVGSESCGVCGSSRPAGVIQPRRRLSRERWMKMLVVALPLLACNSAGDPARRERYEADKERCERGATDEGARKACMTYRGWPEGKFR
jgi:hypothetical protein